ncbi:MAG: DUF1320 domain-containing protein [Pseudomonadales bacterium]|nr:DUF1320 domain-containing protein [Pseudomonadales bacterium]
MSYVTLQDLITRFGEPELLSLAPDATGEAIDAQAVQTACEDASGEIDGYVSAGGYTTPLIPVPRIIVSIAADIARYRLYDDHAIDQVTKRYDDTIRFLARVADGQVQLGVKEPSSTAGSAEFAPSRQVMPGGGF